MSVTIQDNFNTAAAKPTDARYGPYNNVAAAKSAIPETYRYKGLTVGVLNSGVVEEYWWANGVTDPDLVQKTATGNVTGITQGTGIIVDNTNPQIPDISVDTSYVQVVSNLSTSVPTDGTSDVKYPSVKAVKDYADGLVVGLLNDRGSWAASATSPGAYPTNPPATGSGPAGAILKGDIWFINTAGYLGTTYVSIGSSVRALIDSPSPSTDADWDIIDAGLGFTPENVTNKVSTGANVNADPTSTSKYPSVNAMVEYVTNYSPAPTTPDLQAVTNVGFTTTNPILANGISFYDSVPASYAALYCETVGLSSRVRIDDSLGNPRLTLDTAGTDLTVWANTGSTQAILEFGSVSGIQTYTFPNATGTVVLDGDLSAYLTTAAAATTYLTQSNAASTYLTQANATTTYVPYTGATSNINLGEYGFFGLDGLTNSYSFLPAGLSFSDVGFSSSVSIDKASIFCTLPTSQSAGMFVSTGTPQVGAFSGAGYGLLTLDIGGEGMLAFNNGVGIAYVKSNNITLTKILQLPNSAGTLLTTVATSTGNLSTGTDGKVTIPDASASVVGLVNTGSQTFAGSKVFNNGLTSVGNLRGMTAIFVQPSGGSTLTELTYSGTPGSTGSGIIRLHKESGGYAVATKLDANGSSYFNGGNVGIGTTTPNASAILELNSTTQGFLPPRMTSLQRGNILSPAVGLMVYQTDDDLDAGKPKGVYVYDGTTWRRLNWT